MVYFCNRIGPQGVELIFRESIRDNGADAEEPSVKADTTVQEKNIDGRRPAFSADAKPHRKITGRCRNVSLQQGLPVQVGRNFYKGIVGDQVNVLSGAAAFTFQRMLNKYKETFLALLGRLLFWVRANFWVMDNAPETSVDHSVSK